MKAITIIQPWASLIAYGAKRIETRSWPTSYRGPIAIHAGKNTEIMDNLLWPDENGVQRMGEPFLSGWQSVADQMHKGQTTADLMPLGVVVAVAWLGDCRPTKELRPGLSELEISLGGFEDGRFGWVLSNVRRLETPVPLRGQQGLFEIDPELIGP